METFDITNADPFKWSKAIISLNKDGINCVFSLQELADNSFDVCVSFHVLEHLPDPLEILSSLKKKIISGGILILEVPHANDFLLSVAQNEPFKQFTLWSQHLVLHTRESLKCMLAYVGFEDILRTKWGFKVIWFDFLFSL